MGYIATGATTAPKKPSTDAEITKALKLDKFPYTSFSAAKKREIIAAYRKQQNIQSFDPFAAAIAADKKAQAARAAANKAAAKRADKKVVVADPGKTTLAEQLKPIVAAAEQAVLETQAELLEPAIVPKTSKAPLVIGGLAAVAGGFYLWMQHR